MNILFIAHRIPYPPNKGDKIRAFHELKALSTLGNVFLCALVDEQEDLQYREKLNEYCGVVELVQLNKKVKKIKSLVGLILRKPLSVVYFYEKQLQRKIDDILTGNKIDAIFCFSGTSAEYIFCSRHVNKLLGEDVESPKLIMDFCDVDSVKWSEYSSHSRFPYSWLFHQESNLLKSYERKVANHFDSSILITESEKDLFLERVSADKRLDVLGNGVDLEYFSPENHKHSQEQIAGKDIELLFVGAMDYHANVDGVCWFVDQIWPKVLEVYPEALFTIVGRNPSSEIQKLDCCNKISVVGTVEDIRPFYRRATIVVVPLRIARGIQNKVLEAMAMGKAVIATEQAFSGIDAAPGEDVLVAGNQDQFVSQVLRLLNDHGLRHKVGERARSTVVRSYSWEVQSSRLGGIISS